MSPEYSTWRAMKSRCANKSAAGYGGRGITVCARWAESYEAFLSDMGRRPSPNHSLDRIDNDGNYEPGNCRWAIDKEQLRNTRINRLVTVRGVTVTLSVARERFAPHVAKGTISARLHRGWTVEEALFGRQRGPSL